MKYNILVVKETRAGETRVALTPHHVAALIDAGHTVSIEENAGSKAGFDDHAYNEAGAKIVSIIESSVASYQQVFKNFNLIVRVKRPNLEREKLENQAFQSGTIIIGALDPFEHDSCHMKEYQQAGLITYSIDQTKLPSDDPMNVLAAMSRLTGKLALRDAIEKCKNEAHKVVLIGLGTAGQSALNEALELKLSITVVVPNKAKAQEYEKLGVKTYIVDRTLPLKKQQAMIASVIADADIVITSARKSGEKANVLITKNSLAMMKPYSVVVDLALSEGGNVEGSKHDETFETENKVIVTNVSGYPKMIPGKASELWSEASMRFILILTKNGAAKIL